MMRILAVTNMYPSRQSPASGVFVEQQVEGLRRIGLEVIVLHVDRLRQGMAAYLRLGRQLRTYLSQFPIDIVHCMYGGVMAGIVTRVVRDRPTIVTFHGSDLFGQPFAGQLRKTLAQYGVCLSKAAARRSSGIIAVARCLRAALPEDIDRAKIRVIPCGIDLNVFKPMDRKACCHKLGWDLQKFHVLFQNSGDPVKRPALAYAAIEKVKRAHRQIELHELHGLPYGEVPIWLNASDVLLLTSIHEGSPTIVKEALACNVPIVSVDVGDVRERIEAVKGCHLALPDSDDLARKLFSVLESQGCITGRDKIEELSLERVALRVKEFYVEACGP